MATAKQLFEQLNKLRGSKTVLVGIGNTLKGDDGIGPVVCQQLRQAIVSAELIDAGTVPENYIQRIIKKAPQNLLIIDAVDFQAAPGTIEIFRPERLNSFVFSTHALSPRLFAEMITQSIKVDVCFVGIQPAHTRLGDPMSPQVCQAAQQLTQMLIDVFPPIQPAP
ncbi:MAG: hydrogenase 3 maturation endopeptidase HyCI [Phycisphaerae bacterium]|nr:hydrogenase 3 maturation endopeptidase HyCI [Phycisphaerae bacterium]MDD5381784.1 hydrogenase 3 maturation endopeptidase HyCI [Phycisphaerae bacterium]